MNCFARRALFILIALSWCLTAAAATAQQGGRFALIIGNSHYGGADDISGVEDAEAMKDALQQIGFNEADVTTLTDAKLGEMTTALDEFGDRIRKARASVVVFFFSGHGFQLGPENYLVPIGGSVAPDSVLPLERIKSTLAWAPKNAVKLVFLDACRKYKEISDDAPQGLRAEQTPSSPRTLYAFAAGPNRTTPAGAPEEISLYTKALLHYLKEPGLTISRLLDKVGNDSTLAGLLPAYVINGVSSDFYLRDPVYVRADVIGLNGNLLVVVNDELFFYSKDSIDHLPLRAGHNELQILMSKGKSFHGGHTWDVTEGWGYNLKIGPEVAGDIAFSGPDPNGYSFSGREDHPFKDGPHHGGTFVVAKATIVLDSNNRVSKVTVEDSNAEIWNSEPPFWARDQECLYEKSVKSLNIKPQDILDGLKLNRPWSLLVSPFIKEFLRSGKILGMKVADPSRTFATVWGNKIFREAVQACMTQDIEGRRRDLKASITAVVERKDTPFDNFDRGLTECVRNKMAGGALKNDDIRIWTAVQDRSKHQDLDPCLPASRLAQRR